ncbi:MAG: hypothetical protein IKI95_03335 [Clostridia bacterium]|nr:hypothetical protein [Clostridia bacterium]
MISKVKKIILSVFEILASLNLIFALFFDITKVSYLGNSVSENGFGLLDFSSPDFIQKNFEWQSIFFGAMFYFILIIGIFLFIYTVFDLISTLLNNKKEVNLKTVWVMIFSLLGCLVFFVLGFLFTSIFESNLATIKESLPEGYSVTTLSFIPLIISVFLTVIYFFTIYVQKNNSCYAEEKSSGKVKSVKNKKNQTKDINSLEKDIDTLKECKKLLKEEIISQEEFDIIKTEILNKIKE